MAIINSVLTGKANGKIGNIVLATVKGQTTAREYNPNPTYSDTAGQTLQRGRLRNAVLAWQFLNLFFQSAKPLAKSTESVYNAFIRLVVNLLPGAVLHSRAEAANMALAKLIYSGNFTTLNAPVSSGQDFLISFGVNYFPWQAGVQLIFINYDVNSGGRFVKVVDITEAQWSAGEITLNDVPFIAGSASAYMISADGSKMSNISNF